MKIDRSRFLVLTHGISAALTAASCSNAPPPVVAVPGETAGPTPSSSPSSGSPTTTDDPEPVPRAEDVTPPSSSRPLRVGDSDANLNSAAPLQVKGKTCPAADNLKGNPAACNLKAPGPSCESFMDTKAQCNNARTMWKPRVAEKIVDCHQKKSGTANICKFNLTGDCVVEALAEVCVEPSAATSCKPLMSKCGTTRWGKLSDDSCAAAVSAVADAQKQKFIACMAETCDIAPCAYQLFPTRESPIPIRKPGGPPRPDP